MRIRGFLLAGVLAMLATNLSHAQTWTTLLDGSEFSSNSALWSHFNSGYPWGTDHNGSARMQSANAWTDGSGHLVLASWLCNTSGTTCATNGWQSSAPAIRYYSGTVYWNQNVVVDSAHTQWDINGNFAVPTGTGTWPAFWLTGVSSWPPELDILEFKGNSTCWMNTFQGTDWTNEYVQSQTTAVTNAGSYHNYRIWVGMKNATDVLVDYYIDGNWIKEDTAYNYVGKPMNLIIDLQMEGSSGTPGPATNQYFYAGDVKVAALQ